MHDRTDHELHRLPHIDPETIHAAIRTAHRLRAETARDLLAAAAAGVWRAGRALREAVAHAPGRRSARPLRATR